MFDIVPHIHIVPHIRSTPANLVLGQFSCKCILLYDSISKLEKLAFALIVKG